MIQIILNIILISSALSHEIEPLSDEFINLINSKQNSWKAQKYNRTIDEFKRLLGAREMNLHLKYKPTIHSESIQIPESFDARTNWQECNSVISTIVDQSACGSCWAVSSASVMSDRRCIASNGTLKQPVSAIDIVSCCADCGPGCEGGLANEAFKYWKLVGVVTGGKYESNEGCKPYPFQPCELNGEEKYVSCDSIHYYTPRCETKCLNNNLDYQSDKTYGDSDVQWFKTVEDIQKEILINGPVVAVMDTYYDLFNYKSGVYQHVLGDRIGTHAVRVIGWGTDQASKLPYWLVANSWNEHWGDKGLFKILRGENNCNFEREVCASTPKL